MKRLFLALVTLAAFSAMSFATGPPTSATSATMSEPNVNAESPVLGLPPIEFKRQEGEPGASPWSFSAYANVFGGGGASINAVVMNKIKDLTINGKPTKFHLDGFLGAALKEDNPAIAGLAINRTWTWFDQVYVGLGLGVSISGGAPIGGGVTATLGVRF